MALSVSDLVEAARDQHPAFTKQRHGATILFRFLTGWHRRLVKEVVKRNPEILSSEQLISMPLADFDAGEALNAHLLVHGGDVDFGNGVTTPLTIVAWARRHDPLPLYAGWILEGTLYLAGVAANWTGVSQLKVRYVPHPTAITASSDTLSLPDDAYEAAVAALAGFMAGRSRKEEGVDIGYFTATARDEEEAFLDGISLRGRVRTSRIREVY